MNTKFYIFLVLVLGFSFANAQSTDKTSVETVKTVVVSKETKEVVNKATSTENVLISEEALKETIAATASDIRTYFNRERNVDNIKLLFPKLNKAIKA
ncbi:hypothetical protein FUA26_12645 [Seonamhaeicola algicola]|uniref:TonB-dependent receptor n=1 Tax=Seonamhaeicola algicola TaxID=1719036 RepID=A0A5C7AFI7_9FLAO|nr:hypothetical protein [Seonamhaeicola algicola]TXE07067.1 hypothetical protein FUA26_12645 [Seonamhaeicola algicola]